MAFAVRCIQNQLPEAGITAMSRYYQFPSMVPNDERHTCKQQTFDAQARVAKGLSGGEEERLEESQDHPVARKSGFDEDQKAPCPSQPPLLQDMREQ